MKATFEYSQTKRFERQIDIENIFNTCLKATSSNVSGKSNDTEFVRYLLIRTQAGQTELLEFGPIGDTCDNLTSRYCVSAVNEKYVKKRIEAFINYVDCEVEECEYYDALADYVDPANVWNCIDKKGDAQ